MPTVLYRVDLAFAGLLGSIALAAMVVPFFFMQEHDPHGGAHLVFVGALLLPIAIAFAVAGFLTRRRPALRWVAQLLPAVVVASILAATSVPL